MSNSKGVFEIRLFAPGSATHAPRIQEGYDTINRMVLLMGDISFDRLMCEPWGQLIPCLERQVACAVEAGRMAESGAVLTLLQALHLPERQHLSFACCLEQPEDPQLPALLAILAGLRRYGVLLPKLTGDPGVDRVAADAAERLRTLAPALTYRQIFETAKRDLHPDVRSALQAAIITQVLPVPPNGLCCQCDSSGANCQCVPSSKPTDNCLLVNGLCGASSICISTNPPASL